MSFPSLSADIAVPKNSVIAFIRYPVSSAPAVSYDECMESWGMPISTVLSGTFVFEMLPRVEPPGMSARFAKCWTGTPAFAQI